MQISAESNGLVVLPAYRAGAVSAVYQLPQFDLARALRKNRDQLGAGYDYAGLLGMTRVMFWWLLFKRKVKNPFQSRSKWFCSEFTAQVLRDAGCLLLDEPGDIDPGRLEESVNLPRNGAVRANWAEVILC